MGKDREGRMWEERDDGSFRTNADVVSDFIGEETSKGDDAFEQGASFTLPDVGQTYVVLGSRKRRRAGRKKAYWWFVDLQSTCAVCSQPFAESKDVGQWEAGFTLRRTCVEHTGQFRSPKKWAWSSGAQVRRLVSEMREKEREREERKNDPRLGKVERLVLDMHDVLGVEGESLALACMRALPGPKRYGERDTRKYVVKRSMSRLMEKGLLPRAGT